MGHLDFDALDRENLDDILKRHQDVLAVYRTGSSVTGTMRPDSDVDYLTILNSDEHSDYANCITQRDMRRDVYVDQVSFTRKDLQSPSTIQKSREDKIRYLYREKDRSRILLYGRDVLDSLLNESQLESAFREVGPGEDHGPKEMRFPIRRSG